MATFIIAADDSIPTKLALATVSDFLGEDGLAQVVSEEPCSWGHAVLTDLGLEVQLEPEITQYDTVIGPPIEDLVRKYTRTGATYLDVSEGLVPLEVDDEEEVEIPESPDLESVPEPEPETEPETEPEPEAVEPPVEEAPAPKTRRSLAKPPAPPKKRTARKKEPELEPSSKYASSLRPMEDPYKKKWEKPGLEAISSEKAVHMGLTYPGGPGGPAISTPSAGSIAIGDPVLTKRQPSIPDILRQLIGALLDNTEDEDLLWEVAALLREDYSRVSDRP